MRLSRSSAVRAAATAGAAVPLAVGTFVHVVFPLSLRVLARRAERQRPPAPQPIVPPKVTVLIPARDEALHIADKVTNTLTNGYDPRLLEVLVVDDRSTDDTADRARAAGARVVRVTEGQGKCNAINVGMTHATGDLVIITDANGFINHGAITTVVRELDDPHIALVSGVKKPVGGGVHGAGEKLYWLLEGSVRHDLGVLRCVDGADGAIFGFRRNWFTPIPAGIVNDDFHLTATALDGGYGVAHAPGAHAVEHVSLTPRDEFHRRIRVSAGVWQTSMRHLHLAHPRRGMVAYAFIGHRLLRSLILPCLMPVLALSSIILRRTLVGKILLAGQALVYGAGALGAVTGAPALGVPFQFSMLNLAAIRGAYRYATGTQPVAWERMDRAVETELDTTDDTIAA